MSHEIFTSELSIDDKAQTKDGNGMFDIRIKYHIECTQITLQMRRDFSSTD